MLLSFRAKKAVDGRLDFEQILDYILEMFYKNVQYRSLEPRMNDTAPSTVSRTTGAMAVCS